MSKRIIVILAMAIFLVGCGGQEPDPVAGTWSIKADGMTGEYVFSGGYIEKGFHYPVPYTIDGNRIALDGIVSYRFGVDGDTMWIDGFANGDMTHFERVK